MYNLVSKQNLALASSQFWHISEVLVILKQFGVPIGSQQAVGDEGKTPQIWHPENLVSAEKAIFRKSS